MRVFSARAGPAGVCRRSIVLAQRHQMVHRVFTDLLHGRSATALSIRPRTNASPGIRRRLCVCGVLALALGGFALYAVFDSLSFKLLGAREDFTDHVI